MSRVLAFYQTVYSDGASLTLTDGKYLDLPIYYDASDPELSGLTLNIHFNSALLEVLGYESLISPAINTAGIFDDTQDLDGDALTDKFVQFVWATFANTFPNISIPDRIANLAFASIGSSSDPSRPLSTSIRFTASETASGYEFLRDDIGVQFSGGAPVEDAGAGVAGSVTSSIPGVFQEGVILTAGGITGDPDGNATISKYQWYLNNTAISGATNSSYDTTATGFGTYKVAITYTDDQGFTETVESPDQAVAKGSSGNGDHNGETKPGFDPITGQQSFELSPTTQQVEATEGIIDRFKFQSSVAPADPWQISEFNPLEDILEIPREILSPATKQTLFSIKAVTKPEGLMSKSEKKSFKKQQAALKKSLKKIGRTGDGFAYNQLTGELFVDTNGKKKGFGNDGGLLAILEDTPAIGINNFEFV
jgi:hypothetical protein